MHSNSGVRAAKFQVLAGLVRSFPIVALQEVHGDEVSLLAELSSLVTTHALFPSFCIDKYGETKRDTGSVCLLVDRSFAVKDSVGVLVPIDSFDASSAQMFSSPIVQGRVQRVQLWDSVGVNSVVIYNVHNFGFASAAMSRVESSFRRDMALVNENPSTLSSVLFGDFNVQPLDEPKIRVDTPEAPGLFRNYNSPFSSRWEQIFDGLTEMRFPQPNHFCSSTNSLNKLTRIFVRMSRSVFPMLRHEVGMTKDPILLYGQGVSDHAPTHWRFCVKPKPNNQTLELSHEWCKLPAFKSRLEALCDAEQVNDLPIPERSKVIKEFVRDAALHARDVMFEHEPNCKGAKLIRLGSIARAVWSGDLGLYNILVSKSEFARDCLVLSGGCRNLGIVPSLKNVSGWPNLKQRTRGMVR